METSTERLLVYIAEMGSVVADHAKYRKMWYRGLTRWISPTEMALSDLGAREANRLLYNQ